MTTRELFEAEFPVLNSEEIPDEYQDLMAEKAAGYISLQTLIKRCIAKAEIAKWIGFQAGVKAAGGVK